MTRAQRGFSLIEVMVVVAIVGVLAGMSVAAYNRIGSASAPRNAVNDLSAALSRARTAATENQSDVWVIFYPTFDKRANSVTGGPGAYFLYEDKAGFFNTGGAAGEVYYTSGSGTAFDPVAGTLYGSAGAVQGRLIDSVYLDDYPGRNVLFSLPNLGTATPTAFTLGAKQAPFTGLPVNSACTFCSGAPLRGAIVFAADGSASFRNGVGATAATGATAITRSQAVTLKNRPTPTTETRLYVVAVSGPTAFIGTYDRM